MGFRETVWMFRQEMLRSIVLVTALAIAVVDCNNLDASNPLIFRLPKNGDRSSYFGMSVAIRPNVRDDKIDWVFQASAPRGNVSVLRVREPGAVYRCHLRGPCKLFLVDDRGNEPGMNYIYPYKDRKDEAWIGASMDLRWTDDEAKTVICGSRWANQNLTNDDNIAVTYLVTGVCYLQDVCPHCWQTYKLLPLVNPDKIYFPKPYAFDKSFYYWGLGQAGLSTALLDDLSAVMMGAPGYNNWLGTVVLYNTDMRKFDFRVGLFEDTKEFKRNSYPYVGYAVSHGRFFGDKKVWLLAGAPRSENYHGKVLVFKFKDHSSQVQIVSELIGSTFGEYFGSALSVSDVNSDGFDDLVVGAPLFSGKYPDEGRIYVYLGTNRGHFLFRSQVINGRGGGSRFGTCVSALGDLDQDGFGDVAVGAPYEDSGRGAVYVYRGSRKGLEMEYSQRVAARDIDDGLRGFGISLSRGVDVDGNMYNDVAVGAYLSDAFVVLRSRPIVHIHVALRLEDIQLLDRKSASFNVSICLRYSGSNAPVVLGLTRTVEVDRERAFLTAHGKWSQKTFVNLVRDEMKCELASISVKAGISNFKPLQIALRAEPASCDANKTGAVHAWNGDADREDRFLKFCPIGRKREVVMEVPFAGECGADNVCQPEMELLCFVPEIRKKDYLVVNSESITLSVDLTNSGEPAQNVEIVISSNVDLILGGDANTIPKRIFHVDVGAVFAKRFREDLSFKIATDSLNGEVPERATTHLNLRVEARTTSVEDNADNNACDININLLSDSVVEYFSSPALATSYRGSTTKQLNFTLYYEVEKSGDSPVLDAEISIYLPSHFKSEGGEVRFASFKVETPEWMYSSGGDEGSKDAEGPSEVDVTWLNFNSSDNSLPEERTLFLNCSDRVIRCEAVSVVFHDGIPSGVSSHVKIFVTLDADAIESFMGEKDIIHFSSGGLLVFSKIFEAEPVQLLSESSATFYKEEPPKTVEPYVIALSVVAGGLLLIVITSALVKAEFFRRKKMEELKALKSEEMRRQSDYEFPPEIVDENKQTDGGEPEATSACGT